MEEGSTQLAWYWSVDYQPPIARKGNPYNYFHSRTHVASEAPAAEQSANEGAHGALHEFHKGPAQHWDDRSPD